MLAARLPPSSVAYGSDFWPPLSFSRYPFSRIKNKYQSMQNHWTKALFTPSKKECNKWYLIQIKLILSSCQHLVDSLIIWNFIFFLQFKTPNSLKIYVHLYNIKPRTRHWFTPWISSWAESLSLYWPPLPRFPAPEWSVGTVGARSPATSGQTCQPG